MDFPIVGSLHEDIITKVDAERTINMYEVASPEGKKPNYLHPTPGKKFIDSFPPLSVGRASFVYGDPPLQYTYFIQGDSIYRMDTSYVPVLISPAHFFTTTSGHAVIIANEVQILFIDGFKCFMWTVATSTGIDNTPNLPHPVGGFNPLDITFMDASFLLISSSAGNQNRFYVSALNDGMTWSLLDFALINSRPTILNGVDVLQRKIFFFGQTKSEIWKDAGLADFRFRRENDLLLEHGVKAIDSISQAFNRLFYLSGDIDGVGSIMMVDGGISPQAISTRQMDERIQYYTKPEDAVGFAYKINGQVFYQISFTTDQHTFVFNASLSDPAKGMLHWHELEMGNHTRDIANTHAFFNNQHFITSYNDNNLYEISNLYLTNNNERIRRTRICRVTSVPTYDRITYGRMQVDMLQGVGKINQLPLSLIQPLPPPSYLTLADASDVDPIIYLSVSEDGGITYYSLGSAPLGEAGERLFRVLWWDLGTYRDAIFKWEMFNAVPVYILGAAVDMEVQEQ